MTKQLEALIAKIKKQTESFDTVVLKEEEAKALIAELDMALQYVKQRDEDNQYLIRQRNEREHLENSPLAVKLPPKFNIKMAGDKVTRAMFSGHNGAIDDCAEAIRAAGGTVEGE